MWTFHGSGHLSYINHVNTSTGSASCNKSCLKKDSFRFVRIYWEWVRLGVEFASSWPWPPCGAGPGKPPTSPAQPWPPGWPGLRLPPSNRDEHVSKNTIRPLMNQTFKRPWFPDFHSFDFRAMIDIFDWKSSLRSVLGSSRKLPTYTCIFHASKSCILSLIFDYISIYLRKLYNSLRTLKFLDQSSNFQTDRWRKNTEKMAC